MLHHYTIPFIKLKDLSHGSWSIYFNYLEGGFRSSLVALNVEGKEEPQSK